jgi:hypothetical protein
MNVICVRNEFENTKDKIREHDHSSGKYRGAACKSCNAKEGKARQSIQVFFIMVQTMISIL